MGYPLHEPATNKTLIQPTLVAGHPMLLYPQGAHVVVQMHQVREVVLSTMDRFDATTRTRLLDALNFIDLSERVKLRG